MADLLLDWFGFDQTSKSVVQAAESKQINQQVSHTVLLPIMK